jgi:hypothetical protein
MFSCEASSKSSLTAWRSLWVSPQWDIEPVMMRAQEFLRLERRRIRIAVHQYREDRFRPGDLAPAGRLGERDRSLEKTVEEFA